MMSLAAIQALADEVGQQAKDADLEPYLLGSQEEIDSFPPFPFPHIGSHRPSSWNLIDQLFVDSSGFGTPDEPALTIDQFKEELRPGFGYAIIEEGQFQLYVGVFSPYSCNVCTGPMTGHAFLGDGRKICNSCIRSRSTG